eukprot:gene18565-22214_t
MNVEIDPLKTKIPTESSISTSSSVDDVATWTSIVLVDYPSDVAVLKAHRLNGAALFTLTEEKLLRPPLSLTLGAASNLILARDKLKISAIKLHDHTLASIRSDSTWDHLRNLESLKEKVGSFIELPNIGGVDACLPKKLYQDKIKSFLLTQERLDLVERFAKTINIGQVNVVNDNQQSGLILSGPNGVGKTFDSYLLACIAYVNNAILFYIPLTDRMAKLKEDNQMAAYFLDRFVKFNALQASTIQCGLNDWSATTLLDLATVGILDKSQAFKVSTELMAQLAAYTEHPVMYCFDEHQYFWKHGVQASSFANTFTIEYGCSGKRTILIVSGSAHSSFEHNLPSGMSSWKHPVLPFSLESFKTVIGDAKSGLLIREDWRGSAEAIDRLSEITGRLPREIQEMHDQQDQFKTPEDFLHYRKEVYTDEVNKYLTDSNDHRREEYYRFLDTFFSRVDQMTIQSAPSTLCDTGLIYHDKRDKVYHSICRGAFLALHDNYWLYRGFPTMTNLGADATGDQFQTLVERAIKMRTTTDPLQGSCLQGDPISPKKGRPAKEDVPNFDQVDIPFPNIKRTVYITPPTFPPGTTSFTVPHPTRYISSRDLYPHSRIMKENVQLPHLSQKPVPQASHLSLKPLLESLAKPKLMEANYNSLQIN